MIYGVICRLMSSLVWVISIVALLITRLRLRTTHEPPSSLDSKKHAGNLRCRHLGRHVATARQERPDLPHLTKVSSLPAKYSHCGMRSRVPRLDCECRHPGN